MNFIPQKKSKYVYLNEATIFKVPTINNLIRYLLEFNKSKSTEIIFHLLNI